jgi:hypothetical protein
MRDRAATLAAATPVRAQARTIRIAASTVAFAVLAFHLVEFAAVPYDVEHDSASHAAFAYFTVERFQYGVDVFENAGPLAFAHYSSTYSGLLTVPAILLKDAIRLALAVLVILALRWMPGWLPKLVWLGAIAAPWVLVGPDRLPVLDPTDAYSISTIYLAGLALLRPVRSTPGSAARDAAIACLLGVLALMKHTLLVLAAATVAIAVAARLARRDARGALRLALFAPLFLALPWILAGQHLVNLPAFLRGIALFSSSYNEAVATDPPADVTALAAAIFGTAIALAFWNALRGACSVWLALLCVPFAFSQWKYGMVRADPNHLLAMFLVALQWIPAMAWATDRPSARDARSEWRHPRWWIGIGVGGLASALALLGVCTTVPLRFEPSALVENDRATLHWMRAPARRIAELEAELLAVRERHALPAIRARVGSATIDQYGFRQGPLLLNGLAYRPRPTPITFAAAHPDLVSRNESFYRGEHAPAFVLAAIERLAPRDYHLLTQRDGLALGALFENYRPSLVEEGHLLLERNPADRRRAQADWRIVSQREVGFGERIPIDWRALRFVWASVEVRPRWTHRLRSFLLRSPPVRLRLWLSDGTRLLRRIDAGAARLPFLVHPLIEDDEALLAAYAGDDLRSVTGLAVEPFPDMEPYFAPTARVVLYLGPEPTAAKPR